MMTAIDIEHDQTGTAPCDAQPAHACHAAPLVELDRVAVRRGDRTILDGLSLRLYPRSITAIVGRSGVGKTTLMHTLNGLIAPAAGSLRAADVGSLQDAAAWREHRRNTATIFQEHALIDRLSALDNVLLGLADLRHPLSLKPWPRALQVRAAQALADVGLLRRAHARVAHLSGGERQRVGVARAFVREARLLLGDEPFTAVDPVLAGQLGDWLRAAAERRGATVVIVMHQIDAARALADRIVGLRNGAIVFDGPSTAFDAAAQARVFAPAIDASPFTSSPQGLA